MFSKINKMSASLKYMLDNDYYKYFRVNIYLKTLEENILKLAQKFHGEVNRFVKSIHFISVTLNKTSLIKISEYPEVLYIEFDLKCSILNYSKSSYSESKHNKAKTKLSGNGIGIGIIDTGIFPHEDVIKPNKINLFEDLVYCKKKPYDDNGHGTFMTGLICGEGHLSNNLYRGYSKNSKIYMIKAFNSNGSAYVSDILYGIEYLINIAAEENIRILCLPFEIYDCSPYMLKSLYKLFDICKNKNIIPIVPLGSGPKKESSLQAMSTFNNVLTVGSLESKKNPVPLEYCSGGLFSFKIKKPDCCFFTGTNTSLSSNIDYIPRDNDYKEYPKLHGEPYVRFSGSSFSVAYAASMASLIIEKKPEINLKGLLSVIKLCSLPMGNDKYIEGNGILDFNKLIELVDK